LMLHFNTQDTGIQCGDTQVTLTGKTYDGQDITGMDSIVTTGCGGSGLTTSEPSENIEKAKR
ncbi:MAG: hypothetical protein SCH70_06470, partial [Candidatus Methanoperedens sp.]|nr:hypothetical protein [Candidatus Methanoperedens sp.]